MPLTYKTHKLANGLTISAEINPDAHSIAAGFFVRAGSRDEPTLINGVSHFLEHMMFKGSEKYGWEDVNRIFDEIGARYNAFTSQEMTAYYANVIPEFTERAIEHLSHLLRPAIRQADFDTEKNVILEEIAMYLDDPGHVIYEKMMELHFGEHPLGMSILGPADSIRRMQRDEMARYFADRYGPGNTVLSVTGCLDFDNIIALAEKYCGHWQPQAAPRATRLPDFTSKRHEMTDPKLNRKYTMAIMPGPSAQDDRRFAARILADVLGDTEGSRLYWALVENAIAEDADFGFYPHDGCGSFYFSLVTDPGKSEQALDICLKEIHQIKNDLTEEEVARARNKIATSLVLGGELPLGRMRSVGNQWIYTGGYRSLDDDMATLMAVTPDSLRELLSEYRFDPMTIVTLGPPG
ncbi:MAG: insulinase family protein [Burkholderiales bacterium]|nr:insulinase family protein [Phycisphaerae bacterium]